LALLKWAEFEMELWVAVEAMAEFVVFVVDPVLITVVVVG
jgi:hypothetical protein